MFRVRLLAFKRGEGVCGHLKNMLASCGLEVQVLLARNSQSFSKEGSPSQEPSGYIGTMRDYRGSFVLFKIV